MAEDFTLKVREKIISVFAADTALIALIQQRIYDNVPAESKFPYIRVGDSAIDDWGTKSKTGMQFYESFHTFDRTQENKSTNAPQYRGQKIVNQIQARMYALLHEQRFPIPGAQIYMARFVDQKTFSDDGLNWHGVSRFRFLVS